MVVSSRSPEMKETPRRHAHGGFLAGDKENTKGLSLENMRIGGEDEHGFVFCL